jgi:hypothetical protein
MGFDCGTPGVWAMATAGATAESMIAHGMKAIPATIARFRAVWLGELLGLLDVRVCNEGLTVIRHTEEMGEITRVTAQRAGLTYTIVSTGEERDKVSGGQELRLTSRHLLVLVSSPSS